MATLWVRDGYQAEFERKISSYTSKITDISDQYYKASQIVSDYSGDSNVNSSNVYLKKRRVALQDAVSAAPALKNAANSYVDKIISSDVVVSKSIHKESYAFYKRKGIGPQKDTWGARSWNSIKTTASDFWHDAKNTTKKIVQDIKDFYEEYKYIVNIVVDFLAVAAAIALFSLASVTGVIGVICLIGAIWATSKAIYELATDCLAAEAWLNGDEGKAEQLANRTLTGDIINAGEWLDEKLGTSFFKTAFKTVLVGLEICEFVTEVVSLINVIKSCFNLTKLKQLDLKNLTQRSWKQSLHYAEMTNWMAPDRFGSALNWGKFALKMTGFSINISVRNTNELFSSFVQNAEKNKSTIDKIKSGKWFDVAAIGKISNGLSNDIVNIIMA